MNALVAVEAATDFGSVAVAYEGVLTIEVVVGVRTRHAQALLPALDFALQSSRTGRADIGGVVVGAGPGSFTGVRIAAAMARGLAYGLDVPLYAYSSLAALALDVVTDGPVCVLFDARRGEVYAACYEREAGGDRLTTLLEPVALSVPALLDRLARVTPPAAAHRQRRSLSFAGDGARRYAAELGGPAVCGPPAPRASALLQLAAAAPERGLVADAASWEPDYQRASGAERGVAG